MASPSRRQESRPSRRRLYKILSVILPRTTAGWRPQIDEGIGVAFGGRLENDLFEVKADGKPVPYNGMMAKRSKPASFLELKPLADYRQAVDLSRDYALPKGAKIVEARFRHASHISRTTSSWSPRR